MKQVLYELAKGYVRKQPDVAPGYTVRVHEKIQEGEKQRTQIFEGLVIAVHRGHTPTDRTFTVRRIASGVGVERIFSLCSPMLERLEVKKVASVRRAKLHFLRGRQGKSARLSERFTTSEEFAVAVAPETAMAQEVDASAALTDEVEGPKKQETKK